jgi:hypothetical protein
LSCRPTFPFSQEMYSLDAWLRYSSYSSDGKMERETQLVTDSLVEKNPRSIKTSTGCLGRILPGTRILLTLGTSELGQSITPPVFTSTSFSLPTGATLDHVDTQLFLTWVARHQTTPALLVPMDILYLLPKELLEEKLRFRPVLLDDTRWCYYRETAPITYSDPAWKKLVDWFPRSCGIRVVEDHITCRLLVDRGPLPDKKSFVAVRARAKDIPKYCERRRERLADVGKHWHARRTVPLVTLDCVEPKGGCFRVAGLQDVSGPLERLALAVTVQGMGYKVEGLPKPLVPGEADTILTEEDALRLLGGPLQQDQPNTDQVIYVEPRYIEVHLGLRKALSSPSCQCLAISEKNVQLAQLFGFSYPGMSLFRTKFVEAAFACFRHRIVP